MMEGSPRFDGIFNVIIMELNGEGGQNKNKIENKKAHGNHLSRMLPTPL